MTGDEFKTIRRGARLTLDQLGEILRVKDIRTLRRWDDGDQPVSGPVSLLMEMIRAGTFPPEMIRPTNLEGDRA